MTDVAVDTLDSALDVAVEVLRDYDEPGGHTRVERLARYLAFVVGGEPYHATTSSTGLTSYSLDLRESVRRLLDENAPESGNDDYDLKVWRIGDLVGLELPEDVDLVRFDARLARELAVALIRCAEAVERGA